MDGAVCVCVCVCVWHSWWVSWPMAHYRYLQPPTHPSYLLKAILWRRKSPTVNYIAWVDVVCRAVTLKVVLKKVLV